MAELTGDSKEQETESTEFATSGNPIMIGGYRIIRVIGSGGMGIVYEAEQQQPKRLVALKVIQGSRLLDEQNARLFEREAQALARLKHPGIAAIYESGRTPEGRHFFAMELVRGETLEAFLKKESGPMPPTRLRERLAIFRKISDAIAYAHQRGVIHRDLKPSNIIVHREFDSSDSTSELRVPGIKILDFGLARITEADLAMATVGTEVGKIQGTLPYMSPEQVRGNPDEIDMRSDVYSLGIILYEMIAGRRPYDVHRVMLHEAARVICEVPPEPLTRTWSGTRRLDTDIETIVVKALEKDAHRRYQSVSALGEDISRFLTGQPILARPPSVIYQLRKMAARHKVGFGFAMVLVVLIAVFATVMSIQAARIARERNRANREATASKQVSDFLVSLFKISNPSESKGNTVTAREMLDQGAERIDRDLAQQPLTQASLMTTMGQAYMNLGLYSKADPILSKSLATRRRMLGEQSEEVRLSLLALGDLRWREGSYDEAERLLKQGLAIAERIDPDGAGVAEFLLTLSALYNTQGKPDAAQSCLRRAFTISENRLDPDNPLAARILNNLGSTLFQEGKYAEAEPLFLRSLAQKEKAMGKWNPQVMNTMNNLGILYQTQGKFKEGEPYFIQAMKICEKIYGADNRILADISNNLGSFYYEQKRYAEAQPYYRRALAIYEKTIGPEHDDVAMVLHNIANVFVNQRRYAEAEPLYLRSHAIWEKVFGPQHPYIGRSFRSRATLYREMGRWTEAESLYRKALAVLEKNPGPEHPQVAETLEEYAVLLRQVARGVEADKMATRAKAIRDMSR